MVLAKDKGRTVEVRLTSPEIIEAIPGKIVTVTFLVSNLTDREETFFEELKLPSGCQPLVPFDIPLTLKPGGQEEEIAAKVLPRPRRIKMIEE